MSRLKGNVENFHFTSYMYVSLGVGGATKFPSVKLHAKAVLVTKEFGYCLPCCTGFNFSRTRGSSTFIYTSIHTLYLLKYHHSLHSYSPRIKDDWDHCCLAPQFSSIFSPTRFLSSSLLNSPLRLPLSLDYSSKATGAPPLKAAPQWVTRGVGGSVSEVIKYMQMKSYSSQEKAVATGAKCRRLPKRGIGRLRQCGSATSLSNNVGCVEMTLFHMTWPHNLCGVSKYRRQTYDLCGGGGHICPPFKLRN